MKILAIETSCDETALALVEAEGGFIAPRFKVVKSLVASQIKVHRPFGGVVPNLAKREHIRNLPILFNKLVSSSISNIKYKISKSLEENFMQSIDLIAVTTGPGLEPALWTGIEFAKALGKKWKKKVASVNHMEGHLFSFLLPKKQKNESSKLIFPAISLLVSGGHTILLKMKNLKEWKKLGETRDDAVGEAFDKVARILNLPYPGGPEIEKLAKNGNPQAIPFPRPMMKDNNYDFSFSGLKTAVLYYVRDHKNASPADIAVSFQEAAVEVLIAKTMRAANQSNAKAIFLAGGVAANSYLRGQLKKEAKKIGVSFFAPDFHYNTDNAAMIAAAAYFQYLKKKNRPLIAKGDMGI